MWSDLSFDVRSFSPDSWGPSWGLTWEAAQDDLTIPTGGGNASPLAQYHLQGRRRNVWQQNRKARKRVLRRQEEEVLLHLC